MSANLPSNRKDRNHGETFGEIVRSIHDFFHSGSVKGFLQNMDEFFQMPFQTFPVHVQEFNDHTVIKAELPGVSKEQIHIDIYDNSLTLSVKNSETIIEEDERNHFYSKRKSMSHVSRNFHFGYPINERYVKANFHNGLLTIQIQKPPGKPIDIQTD